MISRQSYNAISREIDNKYKGEKRVWASHILADCERFTSTLRPGLYTKKEIENMLTIHTRAYKNELIGSQPKGFLPSFFLTIIISQIIGWVIRRILDNLFVSDNGRVV